MPGRDGGARQRRAFFEDRCCRKFDDTFLFQHHVFGEHAIEAAAERERVHVRAGLAGRPALEEAAGDLVAGFDPRTPGPTSTTSPAPSDSGMTFSRTGMR